MKYKVFVEWSIAAIIEVEAESLDEAIEDVESRPGLPDNGGDYVDGSFSVNHDFTLADNPEEE